MKAIPEKGWLMSLTSDNKSHILLGEGNFTCHLVKRLHVGVCNFPPPLSLMATI
jgi:hypothetical protein